MLAPIHRKFVIWMAHRGPEILTRALTGVSFVLVHESVSEIYTLQAGFCVRRGILASLRFVKYADIT